MDIIRKKSPMLLFNAVYPGECFKLENALYIKLADKIFVKTLSAYYPQNAVRLEDGKAVYVEEHMEVETVNATIVEE